MVITKSDRVDAICASPDILKLEGELLYNFGIDVCAGTSGNSDIVKTMDDARLHNDTRRIS